MAYYEFDPWAVELAFGGEGRALPAWEIDLGAGRRLVFRGIIDRWICGAFREQTQRWRWCWTINLGQEIGQDADGAWAAIAIGRLPGAASAYFCGAGDF